MKLEEASQPDKLETRWKPRRERTDALVTTRRRKKLLDVLIPRRQNTNKAWIHPLTRQIRAGRRRSPESGDVRTSGGGLHGCQCDVAGVDAGIPEEDPRLSLLARVHRVVQCGRELQDRGRRCPAVP